MLGADRDRVGVAQHRRVAAADAEIGAAADKPRAAGEHGDARALVGTAGGDVVGARLQQPHRPLRQVDFKALPGIELAQVQMDAPLRQAELCCLFI